MARIYISSTMVDLDAHRAAVINGLRKLRQDVVAAEDYVAGEQRPLDRCIADVRRCNIYVGIFAWRYGFVPPGSDISITEAEYRTAASEDGVTPLIFLLNEDAPWPPRMIDAVTGHGDAGARIAELKQRLKEPTWCPSSHRPTSSRIWSSWLFRPGFWNLNSLNPSS